MKKFLTILFLTISTGVFAHGYNGYHHHYHGGYSGGWGWVAPAVIGGAVVYAATRPPVVVQQPPVVVQQPPVIMQQNCTPWTETQNADGSITRTRTCTQ